MTRSITKSSPYSICWEPQQGPQTLLCACPYDQILYGGAAGGGKTDGMLGKFIGKQEKFGGNVRGVIFRRSFPQLEEIESRALEILTPIYGDQCYAVGKKQFNFPSGATLKLRAMEERKDVYKYQGHQYTDIMWDELTQWPDDWWYEYLLTRLRSATGVPCQVLAATNPGGSGHHWVKRKWMLDDDGRTPIEPMHVKWVTASSGRKHSLVFIPAKLSDNLKLFENDPGYEDRLDSIADPMLRRALKDGDWDILAGAAFPELRKESHIIKNVYPPKGAQVWRSLDWGYKKPYGGHFWFRNYDGDLIVWNEIYGMGSKPGEGNERDASLVKEDILNIEREAGVLCHEGWLDPQCWEGDDELPSTFELLGGNKLGWKPWGKGPGSRKNQKQRLHSLLKVVNGKSRMLFCERCIHTWRTLVSLPLNIKDIEDVDTDADDHLYDSLRGGSCKDVKTKTEYERILVKRRVHDQALAGGGGQFGAW